MIETLLSHVKGQTLHVSVTSAAAPPSGRPATKNQMLVINSLGQGDVSRTSDIDSGCYRDGTMKAADSVVPVCLGRKNRLTGI